MATILRKSVDESRSSSASLAVDNTLVVAAGADEVWIVEYIIMFSSSVSADFSWKIDLPAGATGIVNAYSLDEASAVDLIGKLITATHDQGGLGVGASNGVPLRISAVLNIGGTAGDIEFTWAQKNSEGTNTVVHKDSALLATKQ